MYQVRSADSATVDHLFVGPPAFANAVSAQGHTAVPNVVLTDKRLTPGARLLYGLFTHYATAGAVWPGQEELAYNLGVSTRQLRRYIGELREVNLVAVQRRGLGQTNLYILDVSHAYTDRSLTTDTDRSCTAALDRSPTPPLEPPLLREEDLLEDLQELPEPLFTQLLPNSDSRGDDRAMVQQEWLAARIVAHRDGYFADTTIKKKLDRAIDRYGAADVCAAIRAYAEVLASPDHYWTHRWTLADFLCRGLDKFVAEARPLENFRSCNGSDPPEPTYPRLPPGETY